MVLELTLIHDHRLNITIIVFPFIGASCVLHVNLNPAVVDVGAGEVLRPL